MLLYCLLCVLKSFGIEFEFIDKQSMKAGQGLKKSLAMRRLTHAKINTKLRNYRAFNAVSVSRGCHMVPTVQLKARFTETSLCPER